MKLRIHGQYDTEGNFIPYVKAWDGVLFGDTVRDPSDGFVLAVRVDGEWLSPTMRRFGVRRVLKVEELPA